MNIKMYDVNFGECILYDNGSAQLLVDCGSKFGEAGILAYSQVKKDIGNDISLLITHFDCDHYNGIIEMPDRKIFNTIYLPLYIWDKDKEMSCSTAKVFIDTIRSFAYMSVMGRNKLKPFQNLFLKLPKLVANPLSIRCVGAHNKIALDKCNFDLLWPEQNPNVLRRKSNTNHSEILRSILQDAGYDDLELADVAVQNYMDAFLALYLFYALRDEKDLAQWERLQQNLTKTYEELLRYKAWRNYHIPLPFRKSIDTISSSLIRGMNACSIVFHNDICLACGDVTPKVMEYLSSKFHRRYKFVKISHHGTRSYFSPITPPADIYLISNSGNYRTDWGISDSYYTSSTCCTNNNSERCSATLQCPHCNIINQQPARVINANSVSCSVKV